MATELMLTIQSLPRLLPPSHPPPNNDDGVHAYILAYAHTAMFGEAKDASDTICYGKEREEKQSSSAWHRLISMSSAAARQLLLRLFDTQTHTDNLLSAALCAAVHISNEGGQYSYFPPRVSWLALHLPSRVDEYDQFGVTPLMRCVQWGDVETGRILLDRVPTDVDPTRRTLVDLVKRDTTLSEYQQQCALTAADFAQPLYTASVSWRALVTNVVRKTKWYTDHYRPGVQVIVQSFMTDGLLVDVLVSIVLGFLFTDNP